MAIIVVSTFITEPQNLKVSKMFYSRLHTPLQVGHCPLQGSFFGPVNRRTKSIDESASKSNEACLSPFSSGVYLSSSDVLAKLHNAVISSLKKAIMPSLHVVSESEMHHRQESFM